MEGGDPGGKDIAPLSPPMGPLGSHGLRDGHGTPPYKPPKEYVRVWSNLAFLATQLFFVSLYLF